MTEPTDPGDDRRGQPRSPLLRNPYLWFFLVGALTLTLMRPCLRREPAPPPVHGQLPSFELIDSEGRVFGSADLAGRVYVASFICTRCASTCAPVTRAMVRLQERYATAGVEGVALVSFSVDPEHDTPERLRAYSERHGADPERWTFLTGETDRLAEIARGGKFVIVDGGGRIRGYYDTDEWGLDEIFHRSQHVLREQRP